MVAPTDVHVVIGGAGGTGAALVAELLQRGQLMHASSWPVVRSTQASASP